MWLDPKNQIVTKLKNTNCDKTQQFKWWQNSKLNLWQLKNSNWDKTQKLKLWQNQYKKRGKIENTNCDKTLKLKLWQKSKTQIVTKLEVEVVTALTKKFHHLIFLLIFFFIQKKIVLQYVPKLKNSNCDKS